MADQTTLMGLLKTPSQIRKESQERLMQESLARSQQMLTRGGSTALPGIISAYGAQAAQRGAQAGAGLLRGVAGGVGQAVGGDMGQRISDLGVPVEERQARETQGALTGVKFNDPTSIQAAADKIRNVNPQAAAMLDAKAVEAQQAIDEAERKREELEIKRQNADTQKEKAKINRERLEFDKGQLNLDKVLGIDVGQFSEESQKKVVELYQRGPTEGETQQAFVKRLTDTLQVPSDKEFKDTNILLADGTMQRGTLEDGRLMMQDNEGKLVPAPPQALLISDAVDPRGIPTESALKASLYIIRNSDEYKEFAGTFGIGTNEDAQAMLADAFTRKRIDSRFANVPSENLIKEVYLERYDNNNLKPLEVNGVVYLADIRPLSNNPPGEPILLRKAF